MEDLEKCLICRVLELSVIERDNFDIFSFTFYSVDVESIFVCVIVCVSVFVDHLSININIFPYNSFTNSPT